jgi:hypothetical protein
MKSKHLCKLNAASRYVVVLMCLSLFIDKVFCQNPSSAVEKKWPETISIFELALSNKEQLHLEDRQEKKLVSLLTTLKNVQTNPYFDKEQYEAAGLAKSLTDEQFTKLMELKNEKLIKVRTHNAWLNLTETGYAKALDSQEAMSEIGDYYTKLVGIQALQGNIFSLRNNYYVKDSLYLVPASYYAQSRIDSLSRLAINLDRNMPEALAMLQEIKQGSSPRLIRRAKFLTKANRRGAIGYTLSVCDSLKLSDVQIDSLINAAIASEDTAVNKNWMKSQAYESERLSKILTDLQYQQMETMRWEKQNALQVEESWRELVNRKLIDNTINEQEMKAKMKSYYQQKQYIMDRFAYQLKQRAQYLTALDQNMPYPLNILAEAKRASKGNAAGGYAW